MLCLEYILFLASTSKCVKVDNTIQHQVVCIFRKGLYLLYVSLASKSILTIGSAWENMGSYAVLSTTIHNFPQPTKSSPSSHSTPKRINGFGVQMHLHLPLFLMQNYWMMSLGVGFCLVEPASIYPT